MENTDFPWYLTRKEASEFLTSKGYPTAKATLATKATRGGGPIYRLWGLVPLYTRSDLLAWAESKTTDAYTCSAEFEKAG